MKLASNQARFRIRRCPLDPIDPREMELKCSGCWGRVDRYRARAKTDKIVVVIVENGEIQIKLGRLPTCDIQPHIQSGFGGQVSISVDLENMGSGKS